MERKWRQILEQWKDNLSRKNQLLLIFLVGLLLLVVAFPVSKKIRKQRRQYKRQVLREMCRQVWKITRSIWKNV